MGSNLNIAETLCRNISMLRKEKRMTQEQLSDQLGVSFQAVSKWENEQACPDIVLLPQLADIFGVTMDELFGRERHLMSLVDKPVVEELPWPDDDTIRGVVYLGRKLMTKPVRESGRIVLEYLGDVKNLECAMNVNCESVAGNVKAGASVNCDEVSGSVNAGASVNCDEVGGNVSAGSAVNCGDVSNDVKAGGSITCGDVNGNVTAVGKVECGDVGGSIHASVVKTN